MFMPRGNVWFGLVIASLITWRITHLLSFEDGPWNLVVKFRKAIGSGFFGSLMDCFNCLSLWIAAAVTASVVDGWKEWLLLWLAVSGAACLLNRLVSEPVIIESKVEGEPSNGMLRSES